jgi:hypothetical protein
VCRWERELSEATALTSAGRQRESSY